MSTFSQNLTNLSHKFESWNSILFECGKEHFSETKFNEELYLKTQEILGKILELFITSCKFKDQWTSFEPRSASFDNNVITKSQKMGTEIQFGVSFSELSNGQVFYLRSSIVSPHNIRRMGDDFWTKFLSLSSIGNFKFIEDNFSNSEACKKSARLFINNKSNLFRLIRDFMLFSIYEPDKVEYIGFFEIKWEIDTPWKDLIEKAYDAFCVFYNLNNMLYKSS